MMSSARLFFIVVSLVTVAYLFLYLFKTKALFTFLHEAPIMSNDSHDVAHDVVVFQREQFNKSVSISYAPDVNKSNSSVTNFSNLALLPTSTR